MLQAIEQNDTWTWLSDAMSPVDAVAFLTAVLGPVWDVEREVDPAGEVSIIVFSAGDDPSMPTFILYEKDDKAVVATIRGDHWEGERGFTCFDRAAAAIVVDATRTDVLNFGPRAHNLEYCG